MKPLVFILTGATGVGKTRFALSLTGRLPLELISADSLQVFRRLDIGSAKPTPEEQAEVPHHLIDCLDPDEAVSAAWYTDTFQQALDSIRKRENIPLVVGGSGFYLRAIEHPPTLPAVPEVSIDSLSDAYAEIRKQDPEAAARIHPNDHYRIGRALSLLRAGYRPSQAWRRERETPPPFDSVWLGLAMEREALYDRIDRRTASMFERGLVAETEALLRDFPKARGRLKRSIGYREALHHLEGEALASAVEAAQTASRQYAKRQLTWFRKEARIEWLEGHMLDTACERIKRALG